MRPARPSWSPSRFAVLAVLAVLGAACEKKAPAPAAAPPAPAPAEARAPAPGAEPTSILMGLVGSLSGSEATFGLSARQSIELALQEANAAGGMKGRQLELRTYDSQSRPEEAAQAAARLITQDHVVVILGESASSNSMAMADKAQAAGVPMITPTSTNPAVTLKGDYIFRVCFIDPFQGQVMAAFARNTLHLGRVAVLQDNKSAYSVGLTDEFRRKFGELGGTVVATESYSKGDTDFRAQLTTLKKSRPEALFIPGYYTDVGLIARQARELGLRLPLIGGDGWDSEKLFELGGDALEGSYYSTHFSVDNPDPLTQAFITRYRTTYGQAPDSVAALSYDAARLAIDAMKRAPDLSGPALRAALAATRDFPGVGGTITLDADRNALKQAVILQVKGGKARFVTALKP